MLNTLQLPYAHPPIGDLRFRPPRQYGVPTSSCVSSRPRNAAAQSAHYLLVVHLFKETLGEPSSCYCFISSDLSSVLQ